MAVPTFWCNSVTERCPGVKIPYSRDPDRDGERECHLLRGMACVSELHCLHLRSIWGDQSVVTGSLASGSLQWKGKTVLRGKSSAQLLQLCRMAISHVILKKIAQRCAGYFCF